MVKLSLMALLLVLGSWFPAEEAAAECADVISAIGCPVPAPTPQPPPERQPEPEPAPAPSSSSPAAAPAPSRASTTDPVAGAARLVELMNAERSRVGLSPLTDRRDLANEALAQSKRMAGEGRIFHNDDLFTPATKARLGARLVGENVAYNPSIEGAHRALMASDGHRANILGRSFSVVGVGVVVAGDRLYVTEVFISPVAATPVRSASPPLAGRASAPRAARQAGTAGRRASVATPAPTAATPVATVADMERAAAPEEGARVVALVRPVTSNSWRATFAAAMTLASAGVLLARLLIKGRRVGRPVLPAWAPFAPEAVHSVA